jgi:hypothetical protein
MAVQSKQVPRAEARGYDPTDIMVRVFPAD